MDNTLAGLPETIRLALLVTQRLSALGIRHLIGGSLASIIHGLPRLTQDIDLLAEVKESHVAALLTAFTNDFYLDELAIRRALQLRASFNLIHLETMFKVDVFISKDDAWSRELFEHSQHLPLVAGNQATTCALASAETIVLQKLLWFHKGGGHSHKQWDDILGVLKVQAQALDQLYLQQWAANLELSQLLSQALSDAGLKMS